MSLFSAKLDIYLLPIFPFFTYLTALLLPKMKFKWIAFTVYIPVIIFIAAPFVLLGMGNIPGIPSSAFIHAGTWALALFAVAGCYFLYRKQPFPAINFTALGVLTTLFIGSFALPRINPTIGWAALAERAQEIQQTEKLDNYYFFRFRSGENMDAYLEQPLTKLTEEEELPSTLEKGDGLIFIREKDVKRNSGIASWLPTVRNEKIGNFRTG